MPVVPRAGPEEVRSPAGVSGQSVRGGDGIVLVWGMPNGERTSTRKESGGMRGRERRRSHTDTKEERVEWTAAGESRVWDGYGLENGCGLMMINGGSLKRLTQACYVAKLFVEGD